MPYIYVIRRTNTDSFYAGSTVDCARRWPEHRKKLRKNTHPTPPLQAAWNKYGEAAFEFITVCECSKELRNFYEELFLAKARYNCKRTVDEIYPAARGKISRAKKGVPLSASHKAALSEAKKGKPASAKQRAKKQEQWSKLFADPEWVAKRSQAIKERYKDPELREKMRQQANQRWSKHAVHKEPPPLQT
jgi:hypothetical protein